MNVCHGDAAAHGQPPAAAIRKAIADDSSYEHLNQGRQEGAASRREAVAAAADQSICLEGAAAELATCLPSFFTQFPLGAHHSLRHPLQCTHSLARKGGREEGEETARQA